jgi:formate hydrogenlyase transcriptional activator
MSPDPAQPGTLLIVDDTPVNLEILVEIFANRGFDVVVATDGQSAIDLIPRARPDLILLDVMMPGIDGFETCRRLKAKPETKDIPIIFMTALSETTDKVKGFKVGAVDYITKPIQHEEVLARVTAHVALRSLHQQLEEANNTLEQRVNERTEELQQALQEVEQLKTRLQAENAYLQEEIKVAHNFDEIIHKAASFHAILRQVEQVAPTDATVLILGESGTGKELLARAVHNHSKRRARPLVKVNCASLPTNLIESELFGHEKGAFTGALVKKIGRFELADGGTIFLDEIAEMPIELQAKLLRVLQEGELERLGNSKTTKVDVRVIAATNRELEQAVKAGTFREDLYYRLNVFPITSPPLRERREDISILVPHFLKKFRAKIGKPVRTVSPEAMQALQAYRWPGNVRELENMTERAVILSTGSVLEMENFPALSAVTPQLAVTTTPEMDGDSLRTLEEIEREYIVQVLKKTSWVVEGQKGAASILGLNPSTLRSRMQKLGMKKTSNSE